MLPYPGISPDSKGSEQALDVQKGIVELVDKRAGNSIIKTTRPAWI
jgi:hypothetical protein